ncbi:MAG: carbohydrate kinase family protein [Candidatus Saccharimonas sp.]
MAKILQQLLGAKEPQFSIALRELERMTGNKSVDVRYIADMTQRAHRVMRMIGLDPKDTTPIELYKGLAAHASSKVLFTETDDVGLIVSGNIISFNKHDIAANKEHTYEQRSQLHMSCQVQHGLTERYIAANKAQKARIEEIMAGAGLTACTLLDYHAKKAAKNQTAAQPSILCIGDIFTDAFIRLDEKTTKVFDEGDGKKWLAVPYGQKPKYERVDIVRSVGPSPNAAVSCSRLGLSASLMAWVGGDEVGKEALQHLAKENVATDSMVVERDKVTSYWYVLNYKADRTMLVKSEKYAYKWHDPKKTPDWLYLSYLGEDSWPLHQSLADYLERKPDIKLVFQPGTFQFEWGAKKLKRLYSRAYCVIMNREEAVEVTGADYHSLKGLADAFHAMGPEVVVITDGPAGAYASFNGKLYNMPNYPDPAPPLERTGAGDAFASTFIAGLALGETPETALSWAPINSMNVVQHVGAQAGLLTQKEIKKYLAKAPANYAIKEMK